MTAAYIADTGVFVRCGGPDNEKYRRLRRAVREAETALLIPQRVYAELGGDLGVDEYPSSEIPWQRGIEEGWITVATELDYTNSVVSTVMDEARRFIASESNRDEDRIEKTDTALVGHAARQLETGAASRVVLLTTDKPAGKAAETLLPQHGFRAQIEYRYVSIDYLETVASDEFES